jgi:hypothetical protein
MPGDAQPPTTSAGCLIELLYPRVIAAAREHGITVNRVSQGSGAMLLSEAELRAMAKLSPETRET